VQVRLPTSGLERYTSNSQRARVATEKWGASNLFCASCKSPRVESLPHGTPVIDFVCPRCGAPYQLKSQSRRFTQKITDAEYGQMCRAIREDRTPNLLAMHYDRDHWRVSTLILIPRFAFSEAAIEKRNPAHVRGRRNPWIGCNILLARIPAEAKLRIITNGNPEDPALIRKKYKQVRSLAAIEPSERGWTLDTLAAVRSLGKQSFTLPEVYSLEQHLAQLHPANRHVRDKIRQQLQLLRDAGLLDFLGRGQYRLRS
jgi:type II restriction enzyme